MKQVIFAIVLLITTSCAKKIYPTQPSEGEIKKIEYRSSSIDLPLNVSISEIRNTLNNKIPRGSFYHLKNGLGGFYRSDVQLFREGNIVFNAQGSKLRFNIPIRVRVYAAKRKKVLKFPKVYITKTGHANATAIIYLDVDVKLNTNYKFTTNTELSYNLQKATIEISLLGDIGEWIGDPKVKISVKSLVKEELNKAIAEKIPDLNGLIEKELNKINIKKEIVQVWKKAGKPMALDENIWLESNPVKLKFNNISTKEDILTIKVGAESKLKLNYTNSPITYNPELPDLSIDEIKEGCFSVYLPAIINFEQAQIALNKQLSGNTYYSKKKKHKVKIDSIRLYGGKNGDASTIVAGISFKAKVKAIFGKRFKGNLWFRMFPEYDADNRSVYLKALEITPETKDLLIDKLAPWLVDTFYMEELLESACIDLAQEIKKQKKLISEEINEIKFDRVIIKGELKDIEFHGFNITPEELSLVISANGNLETSPIKLE